MDEPVIEGNLEALFASYEDGREEEYYRLWLTRGQHALDNLYLLTSQPPAQAPTFLDDLEPEDED